MSTYSAFGGQFAVPVGNAQTWKEWNSLSSEEKQDVAIRHQTSVAVFEVIAANHHRAVEESRRDVRAVTREMANQIQMFGQNLSNKVW